MAARSVSERFNFAAEVDQLINRDALVDANGDLSIWGGEFAVAEDSTEGLREFLGAWSEVWGAAQMPYRIWEYTDRITFVETEVTDYNLLERGRVFGTGGDLSLRHDGERFVWHFIGTRNISVPSGFGERNFWDENPGVQLRPCVETALLWGEQRERGTWHDDRVGWADLRYPNIGAQRVQINYTVYTQGGQVAFVWWKELQEARDEKRNRQILQR